MTNFFVKLILWFESIDWMAEIYRSIWLIVIIALGTWIGTANAGYTVTWVPPTQNTDNTPLTDLEGYKLWCLYADREYGEPAILPPDQTQFVRDWAGPGDWKCKMRAFNSRGIDSVDSEEMFFTLVDTDGDGNGHIAGNEPPPIEIPTPIEPVRSNTLEITRKGYYTIVGPDGDTLMNDTGPRQCTSLIECVEWVTKDGRTGDFIVTQPPYQVTYE